MNKTTIKIKELLIEGRTKVELCEVIGISRPTLDKRLENNDWKKSEAALIDII